MQPSNPLGPVEVRRSRNRVRTVTAFRDGDTTVVSIPARFTRAQEREWVHRMVNRLAAQERRRRPSDEQLALRAAELSARYLGGRARATSVTWSDRQGRRWGSCTPVDGTIRISTRVRGMPRWVIDYVLLHELAHLLRSGHGPDFWAALEGYPRTERARGFLEGVSYREERGSFDDDDDGPRGRRDADDDIDAPGEDSENTTGQESLRSDRPDLDALDRDALDRDAQVLGAQVHDPLLQDRP